MGRFKVRFTYIEEFEVDAEHEDDAIYHAAQKTEASIDPDEVYVEEIEEGESW